MKLFNRNNLDKASATLVTGILSITFLLLAAGFSIDIAKNLYLDNGFQTRAQQALQSSMKQIDGKGSININAPAVATKAYIMGYADGTTYADETEGWKNDGCRTQDITLRDGTVIEGATLPYIVYSLDESRRIGSGSSIKWVSENGNEPYISSGSYDSTKTYRVMSAEVHDAAPNLILSMFGMPCQKFVSDVSAIAFGSNSDLGALEQELIAADVDIPAPTTTETITECFENYQEMKPVYGTQLTREQIDAGWELEMLSVGSGLTDKVTIIGNPDGPVTYQYFADPATSGNTVTFRYVNSVTGETTETFTRTFTTGTCQP